MFHQVSNQCQKIKTTTGHITWVIKTWLQQILHLILEISITKNFKWNIITAKANTILGLLYHKLSHTPEQMNTLAYQTLVRPRLEYCSSIWSSHQQQLKSQIEVVQRRAAPFVLKKPYRHSAPDSVSDMLRHFKWDFPETRHDIHRLTFLYKMIYGHLTIPAAYHPTSWSTARRFSAPHRFQPYHTHMDAYKYSLLSRRVLLWNNLPAASCSQPRRL